MNPLMRIIFRAYGLLMPKRAARTFERILLKPYSVPDIRAPEATAPGKIRRVPYAHGWLNLTEYGAGPTILLVHGWGGRSRSMRAFIDPLVNAIKHCRSSEVLFGEADDVVSYMKMVLK